MKHSTDIIGYAYQIWKLMTSLIQFMYAYIMGGQCICAVGGGIDKIAIYSMWKIFGIGKTGKFGEQKAIH